MSSSKAYFSELCVGLSGLIMSNPTAEGTCQVAPEAQEAARLLAEEPDNGSHTTGHRSPHLRWSSWN